jgi:hypothetical protein
MRRIPPPDLEALRAKFIYDPDTGEFRFREDSYRRSGKRMILLRRAGDLAGGKPVEGRYRVITIDGVNYPAHRLAWLYVTGRWPHPEIDHIDGDRTNNRFANLREVTHSENMRNPVTMAKIKARADARREARERAFLAASE